VLDHLDRERVLDPRLLVCERHGLEDLVRAIANGDVGQGAKRDDRIDVGQRVSGVAKIWPLGSRGHTLALLLKLRP
jgi:hypothetical protein